MIIVNTSSLSENVVVNNTPSNKNVVEIRTAKQGTTSLGKLRNMAVHLVPLGCIWTTWDDDDWRSDDYISTLYDAMHEARALKARYLVFTNRLEWNTCTDFVYRVTMRTGTFVFFVYKDETLPKYDDTDTREDESIMRFLKASPRTTVFNNVHNAKLYLRLVHGNNSSEFVDTSKTRIDRDPQGGYSESDADAEEVAYVGNVKKKYYGNVKLKQSCTK